MRGGIGWWHISLAAMLFGSGGVAFAGLTVVACMIVGTSLLFALWVLRLALRAMFPKKIVQQECSPELLARANRLWPGHKVH